MKCRCGRMLDKNGKCVCDFTPKYCTCDKINRNILGRLKRSIRENNNGNEVVETRIPSGEKEKSYA